MHITIHDPREKGIRPPRNKKEKDNPAEIDKLADKGLGLFIQSSSLEYENRQGLIRDLLCLFPYPWLCFSTYIEARAAMRDEIISRIPSRLRVIRSSESDDVVSIICEHSIENVDAVFELYNQDPAWFIWIFGAGYESSYTELEKLAHTTGIVNLWDRMESVDDGIKEIMPYYIFCDEDWNTIRIRCMDTKLYDPFVKYAERLIAKSTEK